jgi:HAE1 family hydrophobic/amphiphilic exporter-1
VNLADIAIKRPVFTTMVMAAMMILGIVSFFRLSVELFPDISFPIVSVTTPYPGASPEEIERSITRPIEDAVGTLAGVDEVRSISREGVSQVLVVFDLGTDVDKASIDVRDRVGFARRGMPTGVMDTTFFKIDPSAAPVMTLVLAAPGDARDVYDLAEDVVKPRIEQIPGVAVVNIRGGTKREISVDLDAAKLASFGLSTGQVAQALGAENMNVPAGRFERGGSEASLRVEGEVRSVAELGEVIVGDAGGAPVRLRDVGVVTDGSAERRTLVRVAGQEALALDIVKQGGGNTMAVAEGVKEVLPGLRGALPEGSDLDIVIDSSVFIEENAHEVEVSVVIGGGAAILIIYLFMLDWRSTFISALALPTSVVTTFSFMYMAGFSLNMMTLLGLSLAIGLLIDDAIVVRENIFRYMEMGVPPMEAASRGTKEIALAVLATTFTILAVFVPVGFMSGIMGMFFKQFALTVAGAVTVSLFVAFTLDPMLSARLARPIHREPHERNAFARFVLARLDAMDDGYRTILDLALRWRKSVVVLAALVFFGSLGAVGLTGSEFFPKPDRGQFSIAVTMPAGTALGSTSEVVEQIEKEILKDPEVTLVYSTIGVGEEARKAKVRVNTVPKEERARSQDEIMAELRTKFANIPGATLSMREASFTDGEGDLQDAPVNLSVRGDDHATLERIGEQVAALVAATPGVTDPSSTYSPGSPEIHARVDRVAAGPKGVTAAMVGGALRSAVVGDVATVYRDGEDDVDVRVRLRPEDRDDREALEGLLVPTRAGPTPLRELARLEESTGSSTIERADRRRVVTITANVSGRSLGEVIADIQADIEKLDLPPGFSVKLGGEAERMQDSIQAFGVAMILAVAFVYIVLASQFESFIHPLTIMVSLPLAIVGALLGLFLTGWPMGMSSLIGIILLMGLVTKNAILLVDRANQLRDDHGYDAEQAIREAGPTRLRPIVMTSAAMVLGMLPTAMSTGSGSEFRSPMAISVIGGVITSTVLTLVVVPVVYLWMDRFTGRAHRKPGSTSSSSTDGAPAPLEGHDLTDDLGSAVAASEPVPT